MQSPAGDAQEMATEGRQPAHPGAHSASFTRNMNEQTTSPLSTSHTLQSPTSSQLHSSNSWSDPRLCALQA
jgi:hypothetical protein